MSDFIANNLHKKVDQIMDVFFGAGVASHPTIIEQINYLLFMRALSQRDDELRLLGVSNPDEIVFDGELEKYHWDNLLTLNAEALFIALEECFRKIPESTTNKTVRLVFRNAHIKLFDKPSLRTVLHQINEFGKAMDDSEHEGKRDVFGDTYEYLLSKLAQAGTSGQFRTPRHIIEFIVDVVQPKKGETIIDPAVGTAGFLVKAFEYLRKEYTSPETFATGGSFDKLSNAEHTFLLEHTFTGFDSDEDMIKFGMMNLYLHGLKDARLVRQNTLTDTAGTRDKYDVVLANPPFAGKLDKDSVAEELQMNTAATEVLFLRYMLRHLTDKGRAGVIVPEGVLFNASTAHKKIREMLLENGLWCVVSLPGGVFNPYAGVKTSILFFDKTMKARQEVLFAKVDHDGFSLGAQRRPIAKNDLPGIFDDIQRFKKGEDSQLSNVHVVSYEKIYETKDFNLSGDRYMLDESSIDHNYPMVPLGDTDYFQIESGGTPSSKVEEFWNGDIKWATLVDLPAVNRITNLTDTQRKITKEGLATSSAKLLPVGTVLVSSRATIGRVAIAKEEVSTNQGFKNIVIRSNEVLPEYVANVMAQMTDKLKSIASGGTFAEFSKSALARIEIPLPPLEVQKRIVAEIENKQKAIDHAREIIATLERERAYFDPSTRAARENWPIAKIGDVTEIVKTKWTPGADFADYIGLEDVEGGTGRLLSKQDEPPKSTKTEFKIGDILYGRLRPNLNKVWRSDMDAICSTDFVVFRPSRVVDPDYVSTVLLSKLVNQKIIQGVSGANLPRVSADYISSIEIQLPPLDDQKQISAQFSEEVEIIAANRKLIKIYEQKITDTLKNI